MASKNDFQRLAEKEGVKLLAAPLVDEDGTALKNQYRDIFEGVQAQATGSRVFSPAMLAHGFKLYLEGYSDEEIADDLGVDLMVLMRMKEVDDWEVRYHSTRREVERELTKDKITAAIAEKEEADKRHKNMLRWLQQEAKIELAQKATNPLEEERKLTRMKTLKVGVDVFSALITAERAIIGVVDEAIAQELPSHFIMELRTKDGLPVTDINNFLPNQLPHEYAGNQGTGQGSLHAGELLATANQESTPVVTDEPAPESEQPTPTHLPASVPTIGIDSAPAPEDIPDEPLNIGRQEYPVVIEAPPLPKDNKPPAQIDVATNW